ncbi:MAG TPA: AsmA family protein [Candidatus Eremiobacteraceae bacterium]|jgi:AsmA protein|nr:AsmA family protein [Candidatus Eremiobacteraceae bacterium]
MSRTLKIIGIVIVVLILLVVIAPFLIPVNHFRPEIEQQASAALGRKVDVGNLSLSLFSGSLGADNLAIADDPKFSSAPFLTAKSLKVGVEMMPLIMSKTLNVTDVVIDSPQVSLIRNAAGDWNYSTLGASPQKAQAQTAPAPAPATPAAPAAKSAAPPSGAPPAFTVQKLELKNGQITVSSVGSAKKSNYSNVGVVASNVSLVSKFPVTVTADLPGGGNFKVDGTAGPVNETNSVLTPLDAKITVSSLNLASTGFVDPSAGLGGILDLDGNISSQNGSASTKGTTKLSKALLVAGGSPASEPVTVNFDTKYDLVKNTGVLNPSVLKIGTAALNLSGTYEIPAAGAVLHIKIDGQSLPVKDLQAFLPALGVNLPKGASLQQGTLSTTLNVNGPTDKLVTTGNVGLFGAKLAGFDLGSKLSSISALTGVKTGQDLSIEKMTSNVRVAPDGIQADNFNAVMPQLGTLVGGGTINAKNQMDFKMAATLTDVLGAAASPVGSAGSILGQVMGGAGGGASKCKSSTTVPFQIQGTTSDPKFIPDVGGLAAGMLKSQLGCVGGAVPGGLTGAAKQNPAGAIQQLGGLFGKKKPN